MADEKGETVDANTSLQCKKTKDRACYEYGGVNDVGAAKMLFSPSRLSGERGYESADSDSKHGSTLAVENNSKSHEADMQSSSVGVVKSEISTETHLTPGYASREMDMKTTQKNHATATEDRLSTTMQDSQHRTESSCSNSLPVMVPVSFPSQSYQETSKEGYLFRNCGSPMDSSNSKAFDRSPEEPVTASSESGVCAQIASKARRNANARNSMKILSLGGNHSTSMIIKGERETSHDWDLEAAAPEDGEIRKHSNDVKYVSQHISSTNEQNHGILGKVSVCSDDSDIFYCTKDVRMSDRPDNLPTSHSVERMMKHEILEDGRSVLATKVKSQEIGSEHESADSSITKRSKKSVKDKDKLLAGFDLNEDFNANELDDCVKPIFASVSSHSVVHVVAKTGIPRGQPMIPLKFEGGLGWKGTAETSAFRPTVLSKNLDGKRHSTNQDHEVFTGIDLNVAVEEDTVAYGTPMERDRVSSPSTLLDSLPEVDQKQANTPWIDLNCLYDAAEEVTQPSIIPKSGSLPSVVDLNLDSSSSLAERSNNVHWLSQASQFLGNKAPSFPNPGLHDFTFGRNVYLADLSTMHHMANNAHPLMASPHILQRMELVPRVASHNLPPHGYYPQDFLTSRYYPEHGFLQEAVNPAFYNIPHPAQFFHEQSSSNVTAFLPPKTEDPLSASGSKTDGSRQFPFLSKESPKSEHMHQEGWYTQSMKRKEPEGGLEYFQFGYNRVSLEKKVREKERMIFFLCSCLIIVAVFVL